MSHAGERVPLTLPARRYATCTYSSSHNGIMHI